MENDEEIVAVIFAAIKSYSSGKKISIKKVKKIDESCNYVSRWLMHNPQTFWRTRKE